jgi:hypothetical protein
VWQVRLYIVGLAAALLLLPVVIVIVLGAAIRKVEREYVYR